MQVEKLKTIGADTLLTTPLHKTLFVVQGLIPQGLSVLSGSSKIGKSWLMLWLGIQVARGNPVWEFKTHKCDVLYLCLEDTYARIQSRLYQLTDEAPSELRITTTSYQIGCGLEQQIEQYLADYPMTKLVIIDTFQKVRESKSISGKNGMYAGDYDDISALKGISDQYGIAVVVVHHVRKLRDANDPFNEVTGSTGITGAADTSLILKRSRSSETGTLLATGRDIAYQELTLKFNKDSHLWELVERKDKIAFNPAVELSYLSHSEQLILLDAIKQNDCTPSHAQSIRLKKLSQEGTLNRDAIFEILAEQKPNQQEQYRFKREDIRRYFPKSYTDKQVYDTVIKLLEQWQRKRERDREAR